MNKIKQTDYAYCAGYIDGDGCFYIGKHLPNGRKSFKFPVSIIISSVNIEILYYFKTLFGGSINSSRKVIKNQKQVHYYVAKKATSKIISSKITRFLIEKKEEACVMHEFANSQKHVDKINCIQKMKWLKNNLNLVNKKLSEDFKKLKNTINPTKEDFAYLAGLIDAECCFHISKYKPKNRPNYTYKIMLSMNDTKAPIFKWLMERFGGSLAFINRTKYGKNHKNQLQWRISGKALNKILPNIFKYIKHKKPVCEELMKFYDTTLTNGEIRRTEEFKSQYAKIIKIREKIITKVHKLNLKGTIN